MLNVSFQTAMTAVIQIVAMGAVGYWLVKRGTLQRQGLRLLSWLSVNLFFPLFIFYQIVAHFDTARMPFWWALPLINISLVLVGLGLTSLVLLRQQNSFKDQLLAVSSLHNAGYVPLLMVGSLSLGALAGQVYAAVTISLIGFDLCLWSLGVWLLTRTKNPHMDLKKLFNPPLLGMMGGLAVVLAFGPSPLPESLLTPIKVLGNAALPMAMIVIGGNLALTSLKNLHWPQVSGVILVKLLLLPLAALVLISVFRLSPLLSFVLMLQACMPTSVTLSIIGRHYETEHQDIVNQSIFCTHLVSMITIPVFLGFYGKLMG